MTISTSTKAFFGSDRKASKRTALGLNLPFIGGFTLSALAWLGLIYLALGFFD